jgi:hypothetical protein
VLLGLVLVLGGPGAGDWAGPEIMGVALLLIAAFCIRAMATPVLVATPEELVYWDWTRRRPVERTEIRSFRVGPGRSRGGWPAVMMTLGNGTWIRTEVAAYRWTYPARIAAGLTALQRQYAPAPAPSGSDQSAVRRFAGTRKSVARSLLACLASRAGMSAGRSSVRLSASVEAADRTGQPHGMAGGL